MKHDPIDQGTWYLQKIAELARGEDKFSITPSETFEGHYRIAVGNAEWFVEFFTLERLMEAYIGIRTQIALKASTCP